MGKILVIGQMQNSLRGQAGREIIPIDHASDLLDGIARAATEHYDAIVVVMSGFCGKLVSAVQALKQASPESGIFLAAQMYEEPLARQILTREKPGADDYFICPVDPDQVLHYGSGNGKSVRAADGTQAPAPETKTYEPDWKDQRIRQLEQLATEDDLTGLKNRRYVREFLKQILDRAQPDQLKVTLLLFDIDNFKHYNDTYGHSVGDNVLKQVGVMMQRCCRAHDVIGRIGGDEFAVVFWDLPPELSDEEAHVQQERRGHGEHPREAALIAERFRGELQKADLSFLGPSGKGQLTISGGLASFPQDGTSVEAILEKADQAMLEAKRKGKNQITIVQGSDEG